jgi:predicted Na+-dependent transporter
MCGNGNIGLVSFFCMIFDNFSRKLNIVRSVAPSYLIIGYSIVHNFFTTPYSVNIHTQKKLLNQ